MRIAKTQILRMTNTASKTATILAVFAAGIATAGSTTGQILYIVFVALFFLDAKFNRSNNRPQHHG